MPTLHKRCWSWNSWQSARPLPADGCCVITQVEKDEFDQITDKHIPQRPMGAVEGASYTLVTVGGEPPACPAPFAIPSLTDGWHLPLSQRTMKTHLSASGLQVWQWRVRCCGRPPTSCSFSRRSTPASTWPWSTSGEGLATCMEECSGQEAAMLPASCLSALRGFIVNTVVNSIEGAEGWCAAAGRTRG